uniref:Secreted protein n=1 Tax=Steinernema glaseri TaxID=37863 RepID=A0A1I8AK04_9BILA
MGGHFLSLKGSTCTYLLFLGHQEIGHHVSLMSYVPDVLKVPLSTVPCSRTELLLRLLPSPSPVCVKIDPQLTLTNPGVANGSPAGALFSPPISDDFAL